MTTDHELLSGIITDMRKRAEANDKIYLFELEDFADRLQSLLDKKREAKPPIRTGRCEHKKQVGGCPLHNLHCGYPKCDEYPPLKPTGELSQPTDGARNDG